MKLRSLISSLSILGAILVLPPSALAAESTAVKNQQAAQLTIAAAASKEVKQDRVTLTLNKEWRGTDQKELAQKMNKAMQTVAQKGKEESDLQISTGNYQMWMEAQDDDHKRSAPVWHATAQMYVRGADLQKASAFVNKVADAMTLDNISFSVSDQLREQTENELRDQAIANFKDKAQASAKSFGYAGYEIGNVSLQDSQITAEHAPRMMAMRAVAAEDAQVPLQSGKQTIKVTVQGSVFLH
ncbi:SIMPL domain-containing protein [Brackiella oedipodis]|uniref:SIMPL domain-containing protein n=1 Tax=Brackiella oedipodis TaxID=124225 RepID=UPI0006848AFB|nr:SIMPL domain-containing protein [Brackiella oedipodis]